MSLSMPVPAVPLILVSHLPSAFSFYASLTQPLDIRYLSATTFPATLHFGRRLSSGASQPLFSLAQSPTSIRAPGTLYLPALTAKQVHDFYSKSRALNPGCRESGISEEVEGGRKAITRDLDGNMLAAIYSPKAGGGSRAGPGAGVGQTIETASTEKEARRVLQWQKEVAKSVSSARDEDGRTDITGGAENTPRGPPRRADSYPQQLPLRLVRRETVTEHYSHLPRQDLESQTRDEGFAGTGVSGKTIFGTLLGAAAGAAVAYAMVRSEEPPSRPTHHGGGGRSASYSHPSPRHHPPPVEIRPARSHISAREVEKPIYMRYAIAPAPTPPPTGIVREEGGSGIRLIEDRKEGGSRVSVRSSRSSKARSKSEYPPDSSARSRGADEAGGSSSHSGSGRRRRTRARSHVSKSHSHSHSHRDVIEVEEEEEEEEVDRDRDRGRRSSHVSSRSKHHERDSSERESYASARSHASSSTIKPRPSRRGSRADKEGGPFITIVGRDGERVIDTRDLRETNNSSGPRSHVSARNVPLPRSVVSVARDIPLPASVVGSRVGRNYYYDGAGGGIGDGRYAASVAPSDSVSSVGIKRERERLRDRMRVREGVW